MKDFVYSAVIYKDPDGEGFTINIPDLSLVTDGDTVESAFLRAKEYLENYLEVAVNLDCVIPEKTPFENLYKDNKKQIVLLVDAQLE